jgi:hypothetical protein
MRKDGSLYCFLCELALDGNLADEFDMLDDEEDVIARSKIYKCKTTASVKINTQTGKIGGWDSLYELLQMDEDYLVIDPDEADQQAEKLLKRIRPGDFHLT